MPGEIISERRAHINRNGGRHHRGFAGDFPRNPQVRTSTRRKLCPLIDKLLGTRSPCLNHPRPGSADPRRSPQGGDQAPLTRRRQQRQLQSKPIDEALAAWAEQTVRQLSRKSELAQAFRYMRGRWTALVRCFDDGRLALDNNPAERACAVSPLAARIICSPVPMPAVAAPGRSIRWLRAPSSTLSTRSTISPTCSPASLIIRRGALPNSCPRTGSRSTPPALQPELARSPSAYGQGKEFSRTGRAREPSGWRVRAVWRGHTRRQHLGNGVDEAACRRDGYCRFVGADLSSGWTNAVICRRLELVVGDC